MNRLLAVLLLLAVQLSLCAGEGVTWRPLGEPGCGGWVTSLAVSPHDSRRVLVGGDLLGVGLSTDQGESWQPAYGFKSWEIADFTWHPTAPNVVWVGTMSGPYVSADGGRTWQERRKGFPPVSDGCYSAPIEKVLFDPADASHLLAFGGSSRRFGSPGSPLWGAVWESRDAGQSWARLTTLTADGSSTDPKAAGRNVVGAAFAAGSSQKLYAAVDGAGVFLSADAGRSWKPSNAGLPHTSIERVVAHPTEADVAWACLNRATPKDKPPIPGGIFKTADGGKTWRPIRKALSQRQNKDPNFTAGYKGLAVATAHPDVMYTSDLAYDADAIYRSLDGGEVWAPVATRHRPGADETDPMRKALGKAQRIETAYFAGCGLTVLTIAPRDPDVVFAAGAEYILRSTDCGKTWLDVSSQRAGDRAWRGRGYSGLCCISFRFHPTKPGVAALLAMDAGKFWLSRDDLKSWTFHGQKPWPWGGGNDAAFAGDYIYATFGQFGSFDGILRTMNGEDWTTLVGEENGLPKFQARAQPAGIYALPDEAKQVWAVIGGKLYHSSDGGDHWRVIFRAPGLAWIAADPRQPRHFYVTGARNVYRTEDGQRFEPVGGPKPAQRIAVDSLGRIYVTSWRSERPGLWRFADGQWTRLRDDYYLANVAVDPTDPNRVAACTNDHPYHDHCHATGVWVSADAGKNWSQANDGLSILRGEAIAFDPKGERLVFGTLGGGYYVARWPKSFVPAGTQSYTSTPEDAKAAAVVLPQPIVIRNGSMTQGDKVPTEWTGRFGDCQASRDTAVFKVGPASLCVAVTGGKSGQAFQTFPAQGGETFTLRGFVKSVGKVKVNVAVQSFDDNWTQNHFDQVKYVQGDADWTPFEKEVTVPDWAARFNVLLLVEGEGKAWLDEVSNASGEAEPGQPVTEK